MSLIPRLVAKGVRVTFGGKAHSGWLPAGASIPLPTPKRTVSLDVTVFGDGGNFILEWIGPDRETTGDSWHQTLEDATEAAREKFGICGDRWQRIAPPMA